jgi:cytochrome P450
MPDTKAEFPFFPMPRACPFDPAPELMRKQREEPVSRAQLWDGSIAWLVTRYDDARTALSDPRLSADSSRAGYPQVSAALAENRTSSPTFMTRDNPQHDEQRRMLTRDFMVERVAAQHPYIQEIFDELLDDLLAGSKPTDLVSTVAMPLPLRVICGLLGVPYEDRPLFERLTSQLVSVNTDQATAAAVNREMFDYMADLVDQKSRQPGDDVLSHLVVTQLHQGALSRDEVAAMGQLLITAGHETTAGTIALSTALLLQHPDQVTELREGDPAFIANAVEEILRYLSPTQSGRRRLATEDLDLGGTRIKAGDAVIVTAEPPNRDPSAFPDPDRLDLHRQARHHLAFGYGIHQCLGQPLARLELQVVLGTLYRRIPTLAPAAPIEGIRFKSDTAIYGVHELPVTW